MAAVVEEGPIRPAAREASPGRRLWLATWAQSEFKLGFILFVLLVVTAFVYPLVSSIDPTQLAPRSRFLTPVFLEGGTWAHPLGTDQLGRDLLVRSLVGLQNALMISLAVVLLMFAFGCAVGLVAGYRGGWIDALVMRSADGFLAFPSILLALVLAVTVGPSFTVVVVVLALVLWARFARLVRGEVLAIKERDYILLARVAGAGGAYIVWRHILPNILNTLVVLCTLQVGWAIIVEASLTFLGAGVPPPTPTWGGMVREGFDNILNTFHVALFPSLAILLLVMAFNMIGDGLRDAIDPRLKEAS